MAADPLEDAINIAAEATDPLDFYAKLLEPIIKQSPMFDGFGGAHWMRIGLALALTHPEWARYYLDRLAPIPAPGFDILVKAFPIGGALGDG